MEMIYRSANQETNIFYGKTLSSQLKETKNDAHMLFVTNQRYYDLFASKINQLFPDQTKVDWHICTNSPQCNQLTELENLLDFTKKFPEKEEYLIIGFGNEGIMDLAAFFQTNSPLTSKLWLIPVSIRSMGRSLTEERTILQMNQPIMQTSHYPEAIFYDGTISEKQIDGKQVDFLTYIRCGIVCDYPFLQMLYKNYPAKEKIMSRPLTGMLEKMIRFYEESNENLNNYGKLFEQAFYLTENGHLLSYNMKQFLGMIFHLLWSMEAEPFSFKENNFLWWLGKLGYPIGWIDQISSAEYLQNVLFLAERSKRILVLEKIGIIKGYQTPTEKELLQMMANYQNIVSEIRGKNDGNI